ncbi:hypothetical protein Pmani_037038 [Petrolisthes manimaculis]|uniref:Major facilitator superfamily associated domain-containing protein n=1 Tax=Petrolisthes manimaculis TaxID=1843537 RepID=A0AAE1NHN1_9EUCA|nr:hypothetical protein Pmani_037038 [Petrolisthes manimaculis]
MACINKNLVSLKLLLFTFYGALGCLMAFLTVHMRSIGLTIPELTWINSVLPLTSLIGPPLVGMLADKLGHYRPITIVCMLLAAFLHTALLFVPSRDSLSGGESWLTLRCDETGAALVVEACQQPCPIPPPVISPSFRVSGCKEVCRGIGGAVVTEGEVIPEAAGNIRGYKAPIMSLRSLSGLLHNTTLKNLVLTLDYNTSSGPVRVSEETWSSDGGGGGSVTSEDEGGGEGQAMCYYPQQHFSTDRGQYYSGLTCPVKQHCQVVCNAYEQLNGTPFLERPHCSKAVEGNPNLTLWLYLGLRALAEMFSAILVSLLEAVALTMVNQHKGDYGREKMFGLLAVGIFSPVCGYLVDTQIGTFGVYSYAPVFYVFDGLMLVTAAVTLALPIEVQVQRKSLMKNIRQLIHTTELSILLLLMTLLGTFWGYLKTFVYVYLEDLGASKLLMGLSLSFCILPSLPFLYKSAAVVQFCGHHYLIMLAFLGYCVRFAGLSYINDPWWALLLESLELFTLNLMNVSAATLAYKLAPKTFVATAQALVWVSHFNIGRCIGTFVGGHLLNRYGEVPVFQGAAIMSAVCAAVYLTIHQLVKYYKARNTTQQPKPPPCRENGNVPNGHYTPLQVADERF